jgi:ABC-type branched-subunit amino acid transport system substrate-binding protein
VNRFRKLAAASFAAILATSAMAGCRGSDTKTNEAGIKTDFGVTKEACPGSTHTDRGCIYLGTLSDLTVGPFAPLAVPITAAQKAFWKRVNDSGGIGGYDIDVTTYVKDTHYVPEDHKAAYDEIKPKILAIAQTLGSPTTAAILADMKASNIVGAPAAWTSQYAFEDVILESGASYCIESMNALDYAKDKYNPKKVMAIHLPGDYGDDAAAGAKYAAEHNGWTFIDVKTGSDANAQAPAVAQLISQKPDVVILTTGPAVAATIIGTSAAQGFTGRFIGTSPTWNPALLKSPAAGAITALYEQSGPWLPWGTDTPGHKAMRDALGNPTPLSDGYTAGWVWSYPLKAALQKAADNKDLTRAGLVAAAKSLTSVDYEGMLPAGSGNYAAGPAGIVKVNSISAPDATAPTGVKVVKDLFTGPTAQGFTLDAPCFTKL